MSLDLSKLQEAVSRDTTVTQSVTTLIDGLVAQIKDAAMGAGASADVQKAIDDVVAQINANTDQMAQAVAQNTPSAESEPGNDSAFGTISSDETTSTSESQASTSTSDVSASATDAQAASAGAPVDGAPSGNSTQFTQG